MDLKKAIEILEAFNAYRRYRGEDIPPLPASATDIGIALDVAIAALKTPLGPNWDEAPEWAQWWSIDEDGEQNWHNEKPIRFGTQANGVMYSSPAKKNVKVKHRAEQRPTAKPPE
jgi:hypothetical protein